MYVPKILYPDPDPGPKLAQALHQTGFGVLQDSPIPKNLITQTYREWQQFFTSDQKHQYVFKPSQQSGYFPFQTEQAKGYSQPDLKEFFHFYPQRTQLPVGMSDKSRQLCDRLTNLAAELLDWIEMACPPEVQQQFQMPLGEMILGSQETLLRPIHYPPLTGKEAPGAIRAAAHEDVNLITLLPAATATGLEVQDNQGHWHPIASDPGDLVINLGDMLAIASGRYYRSTRHRVVNPVGPAAQSRFSMPLFLHPRPEVWLSETITARNFLKTRLRDIGLL